MSRSGKRSRRYYDPGTRPFPRNFLNDTLPVGGHRPPRAPTSDADRAALSRAQAKRERRAERRRTA